MAKSIIKVVVDPCGSKVTDRNGKNYPIDFMFSNTEQVLVEKDCNGNPIRNYYPSCSEFRARIMANGNAEIL